MTKSIRRYRTWLMSGFMILLMLTWLVGPSTRGISEVQRNRTVGRLDGYKITAADQSTATREIAVLDAIQPGAFGIEDRNATHWLLLSREAERAGYVGEAADGEEFLSVLSRQMANSMISRNFMLYQEVSQNPAKLNEYIAMVRQRIQGAFHAGSMTETEMDACLAKVRGVGRMMQAYQSASRLSDREAAIIAKNDMDAAVVDLVAIPASLSADQIADPDDAVLAAHFDKFKTTKPNEGDFGIGYLLPRRVKLEWMTLSRDAFEKAVELDPVEIYKRWTQNHPGRYAGEFPTERSKVEKDMRTEAADKAMQDAQLVVQSEVVKATRLLETEGTTKYKKLPADWEQKRPRFETIAQAVVEELKKSGLNLPLPEVTVKGANWLTEQDLSQLPGIGLSELRQGGVRHRFTEVVAWTRELAGSEPGPLPVQVNVPIGDNFLQDTQKNRYYITVTATRAESAPDSVADIKELATKDFKNLRAFEALQGRLDEFRKAAVSGGLDAAVALAMPAAPIISDPAKKDADKPEIRKGVRATRKSLMDARLNEEPIRKALVDAASTFDPMAAYGTLDADRATLAMAAPKHLAIGVFRIQAFSPLTREEYRQSDPGIVSQAQREELPTKPGTPEDPFSLPSLLKRHDYVAGDEHIRTVDQLKRRDKSEG